MQRENLTWVHLSDAIFPMEILAYIEEVEEQEDNTSDTFKYRKINLRDETVINTIDTIADISTAIKESIGILEKEESTT